MIYFNFNSTSTHTGAVEEICAKEHYTETETEDREIEKLRIVLHTSEVFHTKVSTFTKLLEYSRHEHTMQDTSLGMLPSDEPARG